jgi:IS5 family transposase
VHVATKVDVRLVKFASSSISNDKIKKARNKHNTPEGKLDKDGKPLKFHRDLDSDWVVQKDTPHYGLKEHASVDTKHGFVLATTISPASVNDTNYLKYCTVFSRHTKQKIKKVYADKAYACKPNRDFLALNKIADDIMRKDSTTAKLTAHEINENKKIFTPLNLIYSLFNWGPRFVILSNSILESAIFTMGLNEPGLLTLIKTSLMPSTVKQHSISRGG